ncbi:hypothetical protein [Sphingomonas sp. MS122]|uniref:hypothetical protein n=1 Tax=Sphingomonas sp. MS122 TaxID=3412683 RepID=UPI003C2FAD0C
MGDTDKSTSRVAPGDLFLLIGAPFIVFAFALVVSNALADGDTGWHIGAGAWIVQHGQVPRTDPFSFSAAGREWMAHEWLSEIVMFGAWQAAGWRGIMLLFGTAAALLYAMLAAHLRKWMPPAASALFLVYATIALAPAYLARPLMLALPMLAGWMLLMIRARERDTAPSPWLGLLMLVWVNAHASFVIGIAIAGAFGLEALIEADRGRRWQVVRGWGLFGAILLVAGLCNPAGYHAYEYPLYVSRLELLQYIGEWRPASFDKVTGFEVILLSGLFFLLYRPARVPLVRLLMLLGFLHLALEHIRQLAVLMVVATVVLAEPIGRAWSDGAPRPRPPLLPAIRAERVELRPLLAIAALLFAGVATARLALPFDRPDSRGVPQSALQTVPPDLRGQPVFNEYSFGGLLVLERIRPFIDGRSDMYGDVFTSDYFEMSRGDIARWRRADARWKFAWTILPPDNALVAKLDREPGWRRAYADRWAVIHVADVQRGQPQAGTRQR